MSVTGDVVFRGKECVFEYVIRNFSLSESYYWSPYFKFEGQYWWLGFYPNIPSTQSNGYYLGISLTRSLSCPPIRVIFSVSLKSKKGTKKFERREVNYFEGFDSFYNIRQWISQTEFRNQQEEFLSSRGLTIVLTMRRADSGESETAVDATICSCCKESVHGDKVSFHKDCLSKASKCPRCNENVSLSDWFDNICQMENVPDFSDESSTSQPPGCQSKNKILQDLKQMFLNRENCDVVLRVQGTEFSVHKNILMARSPVLASTFRSNMKENATGVVDIEDIDPSSFLDFLHFLYCGELENLSAENVCSLFTAADKYLVSDLRVMCLEFMKKNLSVETFCETIGLAVLHTETELINVYTDLFIQKAEEIIKTVKWQSFVFENPIPSNELFTKYVQSMKQSTKFL